MVNEAIIRDRLQNPLDFTVADGTGIEKGTILKLTSPRTAATSSAAGDEIAGIAAREKVALDGRTQLAVYRQGIFDLKASGAIPVGAAVKSEGHDNYVIISGAVSGSSVLGYALETAAADDVFQVILNIGSGGVA